MPLAYVLSFTLRLGRMRSFLLLLVDPAFILRTGWMLPFSLLLMWMLTTYTAVSVYAALYTAFRAGAAPFNAVGVDAALLC